MTKTSSTISTDPNSSHSVIAQLLPIAVLIFVVNGVVFFLFAKEKPLRTATNYLLFSLAMCDFMTGLINVPLTIIVFMKVIAPSPGLILGFLCCSAQLGCHSSGISHFCHHSGKVLLNRFSVSPPLEDDKEILSEDCWCYLAGCSHYSLPACHVV